MLYFYSCLHFFCHTGQVLCMGLGLSVLGIRWVLCLGFGLWLRVMGPG